MVGEEEAERKHEESLILSPRALESSSVLSRVPSPCVLQLGKQRNLFSLQLQPLAICPRLKLGWGLYL